MKINLEKIIIKKFCEELPFNWAPIEKNGICRLPNDICKYCENETDSIYLCKKKTYTPVNNKYATI
jgi:hypothetical protein